MLTTCLKYDSQHSNTYFHPKESELGAGLIVITEQELQQPTHHQDAGQRLVKFYVLLLYQVFKLSAHVLTCTSRGQHILFTIVRTTGFSSDFTELLMNQHLHLVSLTANHKWRTIEISEKGVFNIFNLS